MKQKVDLIVKNGVIYTVDSLNSRVEALAIVDGKILAVGSTVLIEEDYRSDKVVDLKGKSVFPGFIDSHCHFIGYALGLQYIDLTGSTSFEAVLSRVKKGAVHSRGDWIVGRGWDQNLWENKTFPDNGKLNELFPDIPVMLIRIDGHVALANNEALKRAGIGISHQFSDGQVEMKNGKLTGILSEMAADMIRGAVPQPRGEAYAALLERAQERCFSVGLTTVSDAGLEYEQVLALDSLQKSGRISMHVYGMLSPTDDNIKAFVKNGPFKTDKLVIRSLKIYADGSLGSRTARLKQPYSDDKAVSGIIVTSPDSIHALCRLAFDHGYQVNTHCIGDSANSLILNIYRQYLKGKNDLRWRIEHAQVVDPGDFALFRDYAVIPSIQATHATSDMYWAENRVGPERIRGAYAYKELLLQNGWIANGTDFPIEHISPLYTFYASVARKDLKGFPEGGFQMNNALTREEALRSMTIWAAKADFLELEKGSLEAGKDADFVILDQDIMVVAEQALPSVKVEQIFIRGTRVK